MTSYSNRLRTEITMGDYEYLFKLIMIGDSNVGKSCLLMRFIEDKFKNQHEPTLGVEFGSKIVEVRNQRIKIQVWDTAGQQNFKCITRAYYKGSIAALLIYDITNASSFTGLQHWLYELKNHSNAKTHIILVGNKTDLQKEREVSREDAVAFAKEHNIEHVYETSAMSGVNVEKPFLDLGNVILQDIEKGVINADLDTAYGVKRGKKGKSKYSNIGSITMHKEPLQNTADRCNC